MIDHILGLAQTVNYGVGYVYFDYMERDQQKPIYVLASFLKQLAGQIPSICKELEIFYDKLLAQQRRPRFEELYTILLATIKSFSRVFLIFDALDECDQEDQRKELLPFFHRLANYGISVFLTSRPHPDDIHSSLHNATMIELSAKKEDIGSYIQQRIEDNPRAKRLVEQGNCKDRIVSELTESVKGM